MDRIVAANSCLPSNSDAAFREVVEKVLEEEVPETDDELSMDATRQFTPEEMKRIATPMLKQETNTLKKHKKIAIVDDSEADSEINLNETQTFKLNIEE